jgi:nucleotide-binding universal stress UspA family protein
MAAVKNSILVPLDFSEQSLIALGQAQSLARISRADLVLMHVIEDPFFSMPLFNRSASEAKAVEKKVQAELTKQAKGIHEKTGIRVDTLVANGKVYEEVQKAAKRLKTRMILMGTNGRSGIRKFIGSNALRLVREAPCPVITIRGKKHRAGCKHILLPLDLSEETKEKVSKAIEIANLYGAEIILLTVLTTDDEFLLNKLKRQMNQVQGYIVQHNVACKAEFVEGSDVAGEVTRFAAKNKVDLVMIMTQQEMNWTSMFIGSEAQQIINDCDVPVLSIRPKERRYSDVLAY